MTPETARMLLHAYIDGEIDTASAVELESQIAVSPALRQEMERLSALHHVMQTRMTRFNAPSQLTQSLSTALPQTQTSTAPLGMPSWWRSLAICSTATAVALLLWTLGSTFLGREPRTVVIEEVVSAHIRSLMSDHLTDFASTDRHSVKPWLSNRLDFAPPVHEFADEGFGLLGARLDYIDGKPGAAIVYRYRQHIINVFVWPATGSGTSSIEVSSHRGYNSATFESGGMRYWAVSDLNQKELSHVAKLFRSRSVIQ
jgi:anti-sigma factor RsiW